MTLKKEESVCFSTSGWVRIKYLFALQNEILFQSTLIKKQ